MKPSRSLTRLTTKRARRCRPDVEAFEKREMLTTGLLSGTVMIDGTSQGQPGAVVQLYTASSTYPIASTVTDGSGNYTFSGLSAGSYVLKEIAPSGFTNSYTNPQSAISAATASGINTINVTVASGPLSLTSGGAISGASASVNVSLGGQATTVTAGAYSAALGTTTGGSDVSGGAFSTLAVSPLNDLNPTGGTASVTARPITQLVVNGSAVSPANAGRAAYLFNTYGAAGLDADHAAGLQLAIWELLADSGSSASFTSGNFRVTGPGPGTSPADYASILADAGAYYTGSAGQNQTAAVLTASNSTAWTPGNVMSALAANSLNFANKPAANVSPLDNVNLPVSNIYYVVNGVNVGSTLEGNFKGGDVVSVNFTTPAGQWGVFSLAAYQANSLFDVNSETLSTSQTLFVGPGCHTLTLCVPNQNTEIDFIHGTPLKSFNIANGVDYFDTNQYIDSAIGFANPNAPAPKPHTSYASLWQSIAQFLSSI